MSAPSRRSMSWRRGWVAAVTLGRWLAPKLRAGGGRSARAVSATAQLVHHYARAHRRALMALVLRVSWWGSLGLWAHAATNLLDLRREVDPQALLGATAVGALCCVPVLLLASARRLRLGAWLLATMHVAVALLVHTIYVG